MIIEDLKKQIQDAHRQLMLARANYTELLDSVTRIGRRINELYLKVDEMLNSEIKEKDNE